MNCRKIVIGARITVVLAVLAMIFVADAAAVTLSFGQSVALIALLLLVAGAALYLSELRGVHTLRRFFRRMRQLRAS